MRSLRSSLVAGTDTENHADSIQPPPGTGKNRDVRKRDLDTDRVLRRKDRDGWPVVLGRTAAFDETKPSDERHVPSTYKELNTPKRSRSSAKGSEVDVERSLRGATGRNSCVWSPKETTSQVGEQHASEQTTELQLFMPWWKGTCGTAGEVFRLSSGSYHQGRHGAVHCERMQATRKVEDGDRT